MTIRDDTDMHCSGKLVDESIRKTINSTVQRHNNEDSDTDGYESYDDNVSGGSFCESPGTDEKRSLMQPSKFETLDIGLEDSNEQKPEDYISPWRSCIALCAAFIFTYSAFEAIQSLQSSLNSTGHLGELSLSILYLFVLLGCFLAPVCARLIGHKGILCVSFFGHLCYTCTNFFPTWATLLPVSAVQGVLTGGLGMSQSVFITSISTSYNHYKMLPKSRLYGTMSFFNGIFFCCFKATHITGNVLSSAILQSKSYNASVLKENKCGAMICSGFEDTPDFDRPSRQLINILFGSFALCNSIGLAITLFGLPHLKNIIKAGKKKTEGFYEVLKEYTGGCSSMMVNSKFVLLAPSIMAQSIMLMAMFTGYPKTFVSCAVGVQWVGYSMVSLGTASALTALTANYLVRYTGRMLQFAAGMGIDVSTIVILLVWQPDSTTSPLVLMVAPAMAGIAQGILQPQQQDMH
ncbi:hypothetical protein RRG08_013179 [Elysia crispata]|uniref:Uncharacterized protein n=1 Tax=Elysia crispata TaxID=231223 RepID=A0AAE1DRF0_9GAST|nr:hypothetical protein RRG08_013179 [Elysia crispata]